MSRFLIIVYGMIFALVFHKAAAANLQIRTGGEVSTDVKIHDGDGIFSGTASFTFSVKNTTDNEQAGSVSYLVTTEKGEKISSKKIDVKIGKNSSESYDFSVPDLASGFYKINFMINVSDYDDTTLRAFGIRPKEIQSAYPRPADFDEFWQKTKDELAKVKPDFKVIPLPKMNTENRDVYEIQMRSLDNYLIKGYMTVPRTKNKNRKFSVLLGLPGYQVDLSPIVGSDQDLAIITIKHAGARYQPRRDRYPQR